MNLPVTVAGTGVHLPPEVVTNAELASTLDTSDEWIVSRTGIRVRRRLAPDRATSDMCVAAAHPALAAAGVTARDVDAIIVGTYTYDQPLPSTALIVKELLGADRALTLDITQAACANGVQALFLATHLLQTSAASTVLVIAADCASRVTAPADRTTRVFFGDAAGAAVLTRTSSAGAGLLGWDFGTELSYDVEIPAGGSRLPASAASAPDHYLKMDGRAVWNTATRCLPDSILRAVDEAGLAMEDVTHFFLHQANLNIITAALDKLGVSRSRAPITVDHLGNTGSAGVFTALHSAFGEGAVSPGDTYVVSSIGAGFQWGTLCFRHG
ncbi:ketoacyl-ACP synthase III [Amycolatopsis sp., V23-08]|uniref:Ketoacyl-ACP synthase III n=1 Tax=Amycolatopsis heterodermiae TaxID=3110235 RepID=A0ABU5RL93_9PSEU|nr:ketoacyl-ACP synthase III [Amycolatopsis sp., V23-08]MEA5367047.1 ketoacyl-ACP synthase III [Amycolatopsis sp., V23-08]